MEKKKVVIVGGGFGGIYVAKGLQKLARQGKVDVTLINSQNYFLFTPLLHEVATGGLSLVSVAESVREIFRKDKVKFHQSVVKFIDLEKQIVCSGGEECPPSVDINYDILVLATGADTNFYDIPGAKKYGLPLKNLRDSVTIRSRIIDAFEQASLTSDENLRKELLTFIIVGGGATGVELAGEVGEFVYETLYPYYKNTFCKNRDIKVFLISSTPQVLTLFPKSVGFWAEKMLIKKGVQVINDAYVTEVSGKEVILKDGKSIKSRTVLWTAGVRVELPEIKGDIELDKDGRIFVEKDLRARGFSDVFVLGDAASFKKSPEEKPIPMFAQVAVRESETVVRNIKALIDGGELEQFNYRSKGLLVSIGQWRAVGVVLGLRIQGRFAWWLWRTIYLFKFISWRKKFRIAFEWTVNLFYPRDITKLN